MAGGGDHDRRPLREADVLDAWDVVWRHLVVEHALPDRRADAIFCFGSRHWRVASRAAALYSAGVAPLVLVTGATPGGESRTEAERIGADLLDLGVPRSALLLEPLACNTMENVCLGVAALRATRAVRSLVLVSWPLASLRCLATFAKHEPSVEVRSAPALRGPGVPWRPTRRRIRFALGEIERLERYGASGHIVGPTVLTGLDEAVATLRLLLAGDEAQRSTRRLEAS